MTRFHIHWSGCPHRRLPQNRIASSRSISSRAASRSHMAAVNVLRRPLSATLLAERERQRIRIKKSRRASRESWSVIAQRRKRASWRARQNIQAFGWNSSRDQRARDETGSIYQARPVSLGRDKTMTEVEQQGHADGAASSNCCPKIKRRTGPYSMMHVKEVPVLWRKITYNRNSTTQGEAGKRQGGEYAHVGPLEESSKKLPTHTLPSGVVYRRRFRDPNARTAGGHNHKFIHSHTKHIDISHNLSIISKALSTSTRKVTRVDLANPSFWSTVNQTLVPENDASRGIVLSTDGSSDLPSRTPSESRALNKFEMELGQYAKNLQSTDEHPVIQQTAPSTVSAHTVAELVPYQAEFQAAGLAVTSAEQRPLRKQKRVISPPPPPTPPKDTKYLSKTTARKEAAVPTAKKKNPRRHASYDSVISSINTTLTAPTTVVDFTPPTRIELNDKPSNPIKSGKYAEASSEMRQVKKPIPWLKRAEKTVPPEDQNKLYDDAPIGRARKSVRPVTSIPVREDPRKLISERERSSRMKSYFEMGAYHTRAHLAPLSSAIRPTPQVQGQRKDFEMTTMQPVTVFEDSGSIRHIRVQAASHGCTSDTTLEPVLCENCHRQVLESAPLSRSLTPDVSRHGRKHISSCTQCSQPVSRTHSLTAATIVNMTMSSYLDHKASSDLNSVIEPITPPPDPVRAAPAAPPKVPPRPRKRGLTNHNPAEPHDNDKPSAFERALNEVDESFSTPGISRSTSLMLKVATSPSPPRKLQKPAKNLPVTAKSEGSSPTAHSEVSDSSTVSEIIRCYTSVPKFRFSSPRHQQTEYKLDIRPDDIPDNTHIHHAHRRQKFSDDDVFKGLQVATAAAENAAVDDYILDTCGIEVRRFLADLKAFEGIGVDEIPGRAKKILKKHPETSSDDEPGRNRDDQEEIEDDAEYKKGRKRHLLSRIEKAVDTAVHHGSDRKLGLIAADEARLEYSVRSDKGKQKAERQNEDAQNEKNETERRSRKNREYGDDRLVGTA